MKWLIKLLSKIIKGNGSCLKTGQQSIFLIIRQIKENNTRMLDTLFIDDFIDNVEQYFKWV